MPAAPDPAGRPLPGYALLGAAAILVSEIGMLRQWEPFWSWHTSIAWTGYILLVDGWLWSRRGTSWLRDAPGEFAFLAVVSIPLWLVFEFYNLFIRNWYYIHLPEHPLLRGLAYAWAFATIWPAIFETGELVGWLRGRPDPGRLPDAGSRPQGRPFGGLGIAAMVAGATLLAVPLVFPSPYLAAPVWVGFVLLLDPLNARLGGCALLTDDRRTRANRVVNLALAGLICGVLWEFWNYWSRSKWIYTVPIMPEVKLFEMPLPGYLGFPFFALECFAMYVLVRRLVWRGPARPISL